MSRVDSATYGLLKFWVETGKPGYGMEMCPFRHVINYMANGAVAPALTDALATYGYTREAIDAAKAEGKTARDIAREIVSRGYDDDDDSDDV